MEGQIKFSRDPMISGVDYDLFDCGIGSKLVAARSYDSGMAEDLTSSMYDPMWPSDESQYFSSPLAESLSSISTTQSFEPWPQIPYLVLALSDPGISTCNNDLFGQAQPSIVDPDVFATPEDHSIDHLSPTPPEPSMLLPIPEVVLGLAAVINGLVKSRVDEHGAVVLPHRTTLKRNVALKGVISKKTGCLMLSLEPEKLRRYAYDPRLFTETMWRFLLEPTYMETSRRGTSQQRHGSETAAGNFIDETPSMTSLTTKRRHYSSRSGSTSSFRKKQCRQESVNNITGCIDAAASEDIDEVPQGDRLITSSSDMPEDISTPFASLEDMTSDKDIPKENDVIDNASLDVSMIELPVGTTRNDLTV
ncbi:hypothetical protein LTR62_002596 [Meristemomyces frigidus]|uniref:Uncharacterized protein n=1 Tax=Meristemomyces frigidus TaxID=1508187 RepID=A0AAN7TSS6_9PEZI|nr:hypothetical protein LTR62_002596 [Meristemomyces frigidus]